MLIRLSHAAEEIHHVFIDSACAVIGLVSTTGHVSRQGNVAQPHVSICSPKELAHSSVLAGEPSIIIIIRLVQLLNKQKGSWLDCFSHFFFTDTSCFLCQTPPSNCALFFELNTTYCSVDTLTSGV